MGEGEREEPPRDRGRRLDKEGLLYADIKAIGERIERESEFVTTLLTEIDKVIVGQRYMIERLLIGLLADGHVLIEGVPGLAKTLAVRTLSRAIDTKFQRIQFTPDLLPADLIGTLVYAPDTGTFSTKKGPIFANLILADEINRAPAQVQSALLEAMQERQVTIGSETFPLEQPFLVLATQNPIEQEGTYPVPEAQVDRFMLKLKVSYPSREEELAIMNRMAGGKEPVASPVVSPEAILKARQLVTEVYVDEKIKQYILDIVFATREPDDRLDVAGLIAYGASPRASIYLSIAARAHAFLERRAYVTPEDIKAVGMDVLRHRVIITYEAEAEELSSEDIVQRILDSVEVP
jgi:MoxR-like ATPase